MYVLQCGKDSHVSDITSVGESEGVDSGVDPGMAYVHATNETIATTPVVGTTIIDIHAGFRVMIRHRVRCSGLVQLQ